MIMKKKSLTIGIPAWLLEMLSASSTNKSQTVTKALIKYLGVKEEDIPQVKVR